MRRRILRVTLGLLILLFGNGCYYVFYGQHLSADKLRRGEELNKYEIGSIYSMHLGICAIGWLYSPEATKEIIGMSFKKNRDKVIKKESDFFQINPGYLWRDRDYVYLEVPVHYPVCYNTHIGVTKNYHVTVHECLFSYLEKKRILHPYTLIYYTKI